MYNNDALFIAVEGINGSGKTTITNALLAKLHEQYIDVIKSKQSDPERLTGKVLYENIDNLSDIELFALFTADRLVVSNEISTHVHNNNVSVVTDRWWYSSIALQRNTGLLTNKMCKISSVCSLTPDVVIYLDIPVKTAYDRITTLAANTDTKLDHNETIHNMVIAQNIYEDVFNTNFKYMENTELVVVDATKHIDEIIDCIINSSDKINTLINKRRKTNG